MVSVKGIYYLCEGGIEKSIPLNYSARLTMPNGDHQAGYFYPTLTLSIESYIPICFCLSSLGHSRVFNHIFATGAKLNSKLCTITAC